MRPLVSGAKCTGLSYRIMLSRMHTLDPPQRQLSQGVTIQEHGTLTKREIMTNRESAGTSSKPVHDKIAQLDLRMEQGK
jgi:hypothetical protein